MLDTLPEVLKTPLNVWAQHEILQPNYSLLSVALQAMVFPQRRGSCTSAILSVNPQRTLFSALWILYAQTAAGLTRELRESAYIEALSEMPGWESKQIETLTPPEFLAFTEIYMADVIEGRIVNDIGNKLFSLPKDIAIIEDIQEQMKNFIKGAVSDAVSQLKVDIKNIDSSQTQSIVDSVYKTVFDIMSALGEE
jgi:hypothetical protein